FGAAPGAPGTFVDLFPLHLVTTASLARLGQLYPDGNAGAPIPARRFRPNLVVEVDGEAFVENEWAGRTLAIGSGLEVKVPAPTPRCVMTTLAQAELSADRGILQTLVRENRRNFFRLGQYPSLGVYGSPRAGGTMAVGDPVRLT